MKNRFYLFSIIIVLALTSCAKTETDMFGRIHGVVTSADLGEPIRTASVTLAPGGKTTVTGSDGRYDFGDLEAGEYNIQVSKTGYQTETKRVNVEPGVTAPGDILLRHGAGVLYVSRSTIEFGSSNPLAVFEIRNTGQHDLSWEIQHGCEWISEIEPSSGNTKAGERVSVTVKIDRTKVGAGKQSTTIAITSNGGPYEIIASVNGEDTGNSGGGGGGTSAVLNGLLAFYTFDDDTADDITDNELNASLINTPDLITDTPTSEGKALFLNKNKEQYLNIPSNPFKDKRTFSVSFWIKDFSEGVIFSAVTTYANHPRLQYADGKLSLYVRQTTTDAFSYSVSTIQDSKWHLVTVTSYAATNDHTSTRKLYVDGKLMDTSSDYSEKSTATKFQFGGNGGQASDVSTSIKLDNIRLYDRELTSEDVKIIYEAEK